MEKFVVSARKYRPATFDTVVGQSHITTTLKNAIRTNHLAQAFLFCGPRGVGKTTCARILAKTINCKNLDDKVEPCNECTSCVNFEQSASFNIHELDAASNNSVEDIRNLIDQVRFPPQDGKYKVYIIDEVHMLSSAAFNAFLKTLEEPPSYAIFILATTEKHKILPTILSRCQIFDFNRIQIKDMTDHLAHIAKQEKIEADYQALEVIAQKADGGLRDALSMFDLNVTFSSGGTLTYESVLENLHILDYDYYFRMTNALALSNLSEALLIYDDILRKGFDGHQFVVGLNEHFRNLLVSKDPQTVKLMEVSEVVQKRFIDQSKSMDVGLLMSALSVGSQVDLNYKTSKNQRLHVEIGLMKLSQIPQILRLSELPSVPEPKTNGAIAPDASSVEPSSVEPSNVEPSVSEKKKLTPETTAPVSQKPERPEPKPEPKVIVAESIQVVDNQPLESVSAVVEPPKEVYKTAVRSAMASKTSSLRSTVDLTPEVVNRSQMKVEESRPSISSPRITAFTPEELQNAVDEFRGKVSSDSAKLILKNGYEFKDKTLVFSLSNGLQESTFMEIRQDLASFVREKINNTEIQFKAVLRKTTVNLRPYTAQEKYNAMKAKNPMIEKLREALNLDLVQ
jgi:DNA polymerase-3 subunit gamma/tau